jgi:mannose-6-phosphate isomerase
MGWPGPWRAAVRQGLDYLQARYRRPDGLYRALVDPLGAPVDDTAVLYDQAFVLLALASAAAALPERAPDLTQRGLDLAGAIRRELAHPGGGFVASDRAPAYLANPLMHLFEAAQAWERVSDDPVWARLATDLAELFLDRLYDPVQGRIREVFDADWRPAPGPDGRRLEPGHHFEWAWLIGRWGARHNDAHAARAARDLYVSGERGVEPVRGLVVDALWDDFSVDRATSRLWPQTERVRAAMLMATLCPAERDVRLADACSASAAMELYFDTPSTGLWRDDPGPSDAAAFLAPASSFYHVIGAIAALNGY